MNKKTAMKLYAELEAEGVEYKADNADPDEWIDENTPPTKTHPRYSLRLDAGLDADEERVYRIRLTLHPWLADNEVALAIEWVATQARLAEVSVQIQNNGIELS